MLVIIGANSTIGKFFAENHQDELVLVGSKKTETSKINHHFIEIDYFDKDHLVSKLSIYSNLEIVFAGIEYPSELLSNISGEQIEYTIQKNLSFAIKIVAGILPKMAGDFYGRFIFIGSKISDEGITGASLYSILKSANKGLSRAIAVEYGRVGITSNVLNLGLLEGGLATTLSEETFNEIVNRIPSKKPVLGIDIYNSIIHIIKTNSLNGSIIDLDCAYK